MTLGNFSVYTIHVREFFQTHPFVTLKNCVTKHVMVWVVIVVFTTMLNCLYPCHGGVHLQSLYNNDGSFSSLEEIAFLN
jgi:hypothetical protein